MSIDRCICGIDLFSRDFGAAFFHCIPAVKAVAAACRRRQSGELAVRTRFGTGRRDAAAVGVKGDGVGVGRCFSSDRKSRRSSEYNNHS